MTAIAMMAILLSPLILNDRGIRTARGGAWHNWHRFGHSRTNVREAGERG
jgi:hypothetical protein